MDLSICFITAREEPHLEWLIDGLEQQARDGDSIELIVVDALGRSAAQIGFRPIKPITNLIETLPKPTIWQGKHRVTAHDFFANANARNTALVLANAPYICFLDDRCKLDENWLKTVRHNARKRKSVICGPYDKHEDWGHSLDSRRKHASSTVKGCEPGWLFGGNFGMPLQFALTVNGCEEGCDPVGLEDCVFGKMLGNVGYRIDYIPEMSVQQDRMGTFIHPINFPRADRGVSPRDKSHAIMDRFATRRHTELTPDLTKLRAKMRAGKPWSIPDPKLTYRDWYDDSIINGASIPASRRDREARGFRIEKSETQVIEEVVVPDADILVGIPCYRDGEMVERCLRSLNEPRVQLLVVDNGSDADVKQAIREKGIILRNERNKYVNPAWNQMMRYWLERQSQYATLVIANSDLVLDPGWSLKLREHLAAATNEQIVFGFDAQRKRSSSGSFFAMTKRAISACLPIPEELLIMGGDDFIFHVSRGVGCREAILPQLTMTHVERGTINKSPEVWDIAARDTDRWHQHVLPKLVPDRIRNFLGKQTL